MEITLQALLQGKPTIIREKEYLATKEYVQPFIDEMSKFTKDFEVHVQMPDQVTISNDNKDVTYNRVWVQAIMPQQASIGEYDETYGLVYALDTRIPVYKTYRAYRHKQTHNMIVFDQSWIQIRELKPEIKLNYSLKILMEKPSDIELQLKKMKNTFISTKITDKYQQLGSLIDKSMLFELRNEGGKVKLAPNDVIKAFDDVYNDVSSDYYVNSEVEGTLHNYYSSLCNQITNGKDIVNRFEKTIIAGMLFNIIKNDDNKA